MKIVLLNPIVYTSEKSPVLKKNSIKDTMGYNLCLEMKRQNIEPIMIVAEDYKPLLKEEYDFEVLFLKTKIKNIFKPHCFPLLCGLRKKIAEINPDYIISSEVFSMWSLTMARNYSNKTIIWHELAKHNNMMKKIPSKIWYNIVAKIFFKNVRVVARSNNAKEFIKKYCKNVSENFIDHGVELQKFHYNMKKENYFMVVSQLIDRKKIDGIIEVFKKFLDNKSNYKLLIVGDGEKKEYLEKISQEYGIEEKVEFLGQLKHAEMVPLLAKAKGLLINTIKDNSMLSIVEAIACGTPILTTDVPYNCYYINKEKLGIVCKKQINLDALNDLDENNAKYVENCINYREFLSNEYHVKEFLREFKKMGEN